MEPPQNGTKKKTPWWHTALIVLAVLLAVGFIRNAMGLSGSTVDTDDRFAVIETSIEDTGILCYARGKIRNDSGNDYSRVHVEMNCYDGEGNQIGDATESINNLGNGKTWAFRTIVESGTKKVEIKNITAY